MSKTYSDQLEPDNADLPFNGALNNNNRWIKLSILIPWDFVEELYIKNFSQNNQRKPIFTSRIVFGSLFVQTIKKLSDAKTVVEISENPYIQYFLGYKDFHSTLPFDSDIFRYFKSLFNKKMIKTIYKKIKLTKISKNLRKEKRILLSTLKKIPVYKKK